jgi:gamma-glutamylputrescine oxidase
MLSYWEREELLQYDVIIVGSGIVGLSTAISIKEARPGLDVLILERGLLPSGASTRNAGFACIGSLSEIVDDLNYMTSEKVLELVQLRTNGLKLLRKRLGDEAIQYRERGSYELIAKNEMGLLNELGKANELLSPAFGKNVFHVSTKKNKDFGFAESFSGAIVENDCEGELHTGKMIKALLRLALEQRVEIKTGCEVVSIGQGRVADVNCRNTATGETLQFQSKATVLCTNAFTKRFLPEEDIKPGRGMVLITKPLKRVTFQGIFHFNKGYHYFREIDGRVLYGGGRDIDFEGEATTEFGLNEKIRDVLMENLRNNILPGSEFEIDMEWSGIMAFGNTKYPLIKRVGENMYAGVRMGGMGVAIGSQVGTILTNMVLRGFEL